MKAGRASRTAQSAAILRAEHQLFDFPHVFDDPIAPWIVGPRGAASIACRGWSAFLPGPRAMRAFIAARSRYAEDQLARAIAGGTAQYVVLGAGLDTFAYRNPYADSTLRVFEVDHPDTQAWKRRRLASTTLPVPYPVTFAPVDFGRQALEAELEKAGFDLAEPTFFSWLGVTPYLPNEIVMATFARIHSLCPQNAIAFDYALPRDALPEVEAMAFDALGARVGVRLESPIECGHSIPLAGPVRDRLSQPAPPWFDVAGHRRGDISEKRAELGARDDWRRGRRRGRPRDRWRRHSRPRGAFRDRSDRARRRRRRRRSGGSDRRIGREPVTEEPAHLGHSGRRGVGVGCLMCEHPIERALE